MTLNPVVLDFETEGIQGRPKYPPKPVGYSLAFPGRQPVYYGWGHPTNNNCDFDKAKTILEDVWRSGAEVLCHNAKFDLDVAETHMGLKMLPWERIHDTMFLLFLADPYAMSYALKPAAERYLGLPPEERDAVREWLVTAGICRKTQSDWGAHIAEAPGDVVGRYAKGDVTRTKQLFQKLMPRVASQGMTEAYNRERQLLPILLENERQGINVNLRALNRDVGVYQQALETADRHIAKLLKTPDLNIDADADLAQALLKSGCVTDWEYTATGRLKTSKDSLTPDKFHDKQVSSLLGYRNRLATALRTFMGPWLNTANESGGSIYTNWNQVRQVGGGGASGFAGTRTGRLSSNPNFQNIPKSWTDKDDGYEHPTALELPVLPLLRRYIIPDRGGVLAHRDYSQQELRILAHYEDGQLLRGYLANPKYDVHGIVQRGLAEVLGHEFPRVNVKRFVFQKLYGGGIPAIMGSLKCDDVTARSVVQALLAILPGYNKLNEDVKERGAFGEPIRTWGGRVYHVETPKIIDGRRRTFEYKMLNYLIQGSAADCTKEALIRYDAMRKDGRLLVTVHDEINISVPKSAIKEEMAILKEAMEGVKFDVAMISEGKIGSNWASLKDYV